MQVKQYHVKARDPFFGFVLSHDGRKTLAYETRGDGGWARFHALSFLADWIDSGEVMTVDFATWNLVSGEVEYAAKTAYQLAAFLAAPIIDKIEGAVNEAVVDIPPSHGFRLRVREKLADGQFRLPIDAPYALRQQIMDNAYAVSQWAVNFHAEGDYAYEFHRDSYEADSDPLGGLEEYLPAIAAWDWQGDEVAAWISEIEEAAKQHGGYEVNHWYDGGEVVVNYPAGQWIAELDIDKAKQVVVE